MILAVDSTSTLASVAVVNELDNRIVSVRRAQVTRHSDDLLAMIGEALDEAGVLVKDLDAIACAAGPGSFTGLRIGLATVKGLCLATARPLVMISSLESLAARAPAGTRTLATIDALKGEVYAQWLTAGLPPVSLGDARVLSPERLALDFSREDSFSIIGDALVRYPALAVAQARVVDTNPSDAVEIGRLAIVRRARGESDPLAAAAPRYVRPSEAELLADARH